MQDDREPMLIALKHKDERLQAASMEADELEIKKNAVTS